LVDFNFYPGGDPIGSLTLGRDGDFYGTTYLGGPNYDGAIFKWSTNGTMKTLHSFNYNDGAILYGGLCLGRALHLVERCARDESLQPPNAMLAAKVQPQLLSTGWQKSRGRQTRRRES